MYDFRPVHEPTTRIAELVLWASIVAGPTPQVGTDSWGMPVVTGWQEGLPTVCLNKDGAYMGTLAYRGADVRMLEQEERLVYLHRLHGVLKRLGTGWALLADEWHEETRQYPTSQWSNPVACFLDASRRGTVASGQLHESRQYLTLTWKPESTRKQAWYEHLFTTGTHIQTTDAENRERFSKQITHWGDALAGVLPEVRWLTPDETVTYLANTVRWDRTPLKLPAVPMYLDSQLTSCDFLPGHTPQLGHVLAGSTPPRLEKFLRPIAVKSWPDVLGHTIPLALQEALPFPYRYTVRWIALDKHDGEDVLRDYQSKWAQLIWDGWQILSWLFPADAQDQTDSLEEPLLDIRADRVSYGYCTPVVTVWGDTEEELAYREREAIKALQSQGLLCLPEVVNAAQAWQGTLPGDVYHGVRTPPLPSLALAFLLPHSTIWAGPEHDAHLDDEVLFSASSAGTPFRYALHPRGQVGNAHMTGPTRSGKSAMLGFQGFQFLRYAGAQVFGFDVDYQLYCPTMLIGGSHYDLGTSNGARFHVLGRVDESEDERRWAQGWLEHLFTAQGLPPTPEEQLEIFAALGRVAQRSPALRTLSTFVDCLQVTRLKPALRPFLRGGAYPYLDAPSDSFRLDWWTMFEMREILKQPTALPHVMSYIFHRLEERFDGRPTFIVMDEVATIFAHTIMQQVGADYLKTKAKKNVSVLLSWQEIVDASTLHIWQAIQASSDIELYLPNDKALNTDVRPHYEQMQLQPGHIQAIAMARPLQDYFYKSQQGSRLFQLRLSPLERLLCAASSQEEIAVMRELVRTPRTESLCATWLRHWGYDTEADIFEEDYACQRSVAMV